MAFEESAVQGEGLWQEGLRPGSPSVQMRTGRSRGRVGRWGSGTPHTPALTSVGSFSSKFQLLACKMGGTPPPTGSAWTLDGGAAPLTLTFCLCILVLPSRGPCILCLSY